MTLLVARPKLGRFQPRRLGSEEEVDANGVLLAWLVGIAWRRVTRDRTRARSRLEVRMGNVPASRATLIAGALQKLRAELDLETQESAVPTRTAPPQECVTEIGDERLARVDALAARLGVSRDEMLARCIARGLDEIEANRTRTGDRGQGG